MSVHDMYPASQWRYRQNQQHPPHPPPHHHHHSQPHPHYHRPPPPRYPRRRVSMPLMGGPRTGMLALMNIFSPNPAPRYPNRPPYPHQAYYPASSPINNSAPPIIIDILKTGSMDIEYNILLKYYRNKYFELKSDSKLYYFSSQNNTYKKANGVINLLNVISLKKVNKTMFEIEVNNKTSDGVDIIQLLTPDITIWRFRCNSMEQRNDWFDCIRCFVSQNANVVYIERRHENNDAKDDEWCVVETKNDGIFTKILPKKKVMDDGLDLDVTEPQEPGMNGNNQEDDEYIPPPAYAHMEGNNDNAMDYADEGKVTFQ